MERFVQFWGIGVKLVSLALPFYRHSFFRGSRYLLFCCNQFFQAFRRNIHFITPLRHQFHIQLMQNLFVLVAEYLIETPQPAFVVEGA